MASERDRPGHAAPPITRNPYDTVPRWLRFVWRPVRTATGARRLGLAAVALVASPVALVGAIGIGIVRHLVLMARLTRRELDLARGHAADELTVPAVDELPPRARRAEHVDHR